MALGLTDYIIIFNVNFIFSYLIFYLILSKRAYKGKMNKMFGKMDKIASLFKKSGGK